MNSAQRLLNIYTGFSNTTSSVTMMRAWQDILGIRETLGMESVIPCCVAAMREVRVMRKQLASIGVPPSVYTDACDQLMNAFPPTHLSHQWASFQGNMSQRAVPLTLEWAAWALSKFDEPDIDAKALADLQQSIAEQESMLKDANLPESLKEMLETQIADLRAALLLYNIEGRQPLYDAVNKQTGAMQHVSAEDVAEAVKTKEGTGVLRRAVELYQAAGKAADTGNRLFQFTDRLKQLGHSLGEWIALLPPPG